MNLFEGLEKFGLKAKDTDNLFEEEKKEEKAGSKEVKEEIPAEDTFLLDKTFRCTVCDQSFKSKVIKSGRAKRLEPDKDLRPRFQYIDPIKYDVASCPHCGYTAMLRYFEHLSSLQIKLIKEQVSANFKPEKSVQTSVCDYDTAIGRYKMSLYNTMVKKGKNSEMAYTCLKIAWLYRGKQETLDPKDPASEAARKEAAEQQELFYGQAFEGFMKAVSSEMFPMCGMDQDTLDYLLGVMAAHFKKYDIASKCISRVLTSVSASKKMKEFAYDLKEQVVSEIRNGN